MTAQPVIRRAVAEDADALTDLALRSKAHWGYDAAFMAACVEELTTTAGAISTNEIWLAEACGEIIGFYELIAYTGRRYGEIRMCFVAPEHMGRGIGRRLWGHVEARAAAHNLERLGLDADPNAVPFYSAMGMAVIGESPSGSIAGRMLPRMEKQLPAP